jgi:predicted transcriptional regulator
MAVLSKEKYNKKQRGRKMSKTLTEMAAEILAARVKHEAMTSKQIESCLDDTFEALQKLKEREDAILGNAGQPIITPEKPSQAKPEEPSKPAVQPKKATISSTILDIIKSKPRGVNTNYIMEQTGFKKNQVWATINGAKKKGLVKTKKRGIYVSVKSREVK